MDSSSRYEWYGVQDPRERKRIQDRLAQRSRRKRLLEARENPEHCSAAQSAPDRYQPIASHPESTLSRTSTNATASEKLHNLCLALDSSPCGTSSSHSSNQSSSSWPKLSCDTRVFFPDSRARALAALVVNGTILGLHCSADNRHLIISSPQAKNIPKSLQPSQLQLTTPHYAWIDRFPFPLVRDRMIIWSDCIDADELFKDFFALESLTLKEEAAAWDEKAWQIGPEFARKWAWFFLPSAVVFPVASQKKKGQRKRDHLPRACKSPEPEEEDDGEEEEEEEEEEAEEEEAEEIPSTQDDKDCGEVEEVAEGAAYQAMEVVEVAAEAGNDHSIEERVK